MTQSVTTIDAGRWSQEWLQTAGMNTLELDIVRDNEGVISSANGIPFFFLSLISPHEVIQSIVSPEHPTLREHKVHVVAFNYDDTKGNTLVKEFPLTISADRTTSVPELEGIVAPFVFLNFGDHGYGKFLLEESVRA